MAESIAIATASTTTAAANTTIAANVQLLKLRY